jgi:hypothetical protein
MPVPVLMGSSQHRPADLHSGENEADRDVDGLDGAQRRAEKPLSEVHIGKISLRSREVVTCGAKRRLLRRK